MGVRGGGWGAWVCAGSGERRLVRRLSSPAGLVLCCAPSSPSSAPQERKAALLSWRRQERGGDQVVCCACACELRRARVLSLAQCDVGRGGWSRELHFPPRHPPTSTASPHPLRLPTSLPTPPPLAQPPAAICITKARRSWEEKGRGVRLSPRPRGQGVAALTPLPSNSSTPN
jgi:hypothetical protein